jgi:hypothetical protein
VPRGHGPRFGFRRHSAQRKPQKGQLLGRGREQEIGLVAVRVGGAMQFRPGGPHDPPDIVPGRHAIGIQIARGAQQVLELHPLVAADAGHRRCAAQIGVGELVHHRFAEHAFIVEHIMRKAHRLGHAAGVMDIAARAARALLRQRRAMVVKLQRDSDHIVARARQLGRDHRGIDAARHRHDHAGIGRRLGKTQGIQRFGHRRAPVGRPTQYRKIRRVLNAAVSPGFKHARRYLRHGGWEPEGAMYLKRMEGPNHVVLPDGSRMTGRTCRRATPGTLGGTPQGRGGARGAVRADLERGGAAPLYGLSPEEFEAGNMPSRCPIRRGRAQGDGHKKYRQL